MRRRRPDKSPRGRERTHIDKIALTFHLDRETDRDREGERGREGQVLSASAASEKGSSPSSSLRAAAWLPSAWTLGTRIEPRPQSIAPCWQSQRGSPEQSTASPFRSLYRRRRSSGTPCHLLHRPDPAPSFSSDLSSRPGIPAWPARGSREPETPTLRWLNAGERHHHCRRPPEPSSAAWASRVFSWQMNGNRPPVFPCRSRMRLGIPDRCAPCSPAAASTARAAPPSCDQFTRQVRINSRTGWRNRIFCTV